MNKLYVLLAVIALIVFCTSTFVETASADWSTFRGDLARGGYTNSSGIANSAKQLWNYSTSASVWSSPAVSEGRMVVGCKDCHIYCLNISNGDLFWSFPTGHEVNSSPAIEGEFAIVGCDDGWVYCMNITSGLPVWIDCVRGYIRSSPAVFDGRVYIGSGDHDLYCLNATDGSLIWTFPTPYRVDSSPAVFEGAVYFACDDFNVYAVNASSGQEIWRQHTGSNSNTPCLWGGYLYIGSYEGYFWALNASTGAKVWKFTTQDTITSAAAVANGRVYVGSEDRSLYCLNASTGQKIWSTQTGYYIMSSPAVSNDSVFVGSQDYSVYCFDAYTGSQKWHYSTGCSVDSSPTIVNGTLYFGSFDYHIYALILLDSFDQTPKSRSSVTFSTTVFFDVISAVVLVGAVLTFVYFIQIRNRGLKNSSGIPPNGTWLSIHASHLCAVIIAMFLVVFYFSLAAGPLWAADEKTYSQMAYHIVKSGDYFLPWSFGEPAIWAGKPPLLMWLMSLSYQVFGVNNFSTRLWSPIFGALSLAMVFYLGKKLYNAEVGLLSVVVLGTFTTFFAFATHAMTDGPLLFFLLAAVYCLLSSEKQKNGNWYGVLAGVFFGLALMTKQIEALLIPLIIILYFSLSTKNIKFLFTKRFTYFWAIALLIFLPYVVYMQIRFPKDFWNCYFEYSFFSRATTSIEGHSGGLLFYFNYLMVNDNPLWLVLLPIAGGLSIFKMVFRRSKSDLLIIVWAAVVIVLFTLAQTKIYWYILPALPVFAIAIGSLLFDASNYRLKHTKPH